MSARADDTPGQFFYFYVDFCEQARYALPEAHVDVDGSLRHTIHAWVLGHLMWLVHHPCSELPLEAPWVWHPVNHLFCGLGRCMAGRVSGSLLCLAGADMRATTMPQQSDP